MLMNRDTRQRQESDGKVGNDTEEKRPQQECEQRALEQDPPNSTHVICLDNMRHQGDSFDP